MQEDFYMALRRQKFKEDEKDSDNDLSNENKDVLVDFNLKNPLASIEYNRRRRREASEPPRYY